MIKITFDKESEFVWIKNVIENGVLNLRDGDPFVETFKKHDLSLNQKVTYIKSDIYEDDCVEAREGERKELELLKKEKEKNI